MAIFWVTPGSDVLKEWRWSHRSDMLRKAEKISATNDQGTQHKKIQAYVNEAEGVVTVKRPKTVMDIMSREVISIPRGASLNEVSKVIQDTGFRALPVVNEANTPVGMITERQILKLRLSMRYSEFLREKAGTSSTEAFFMTTADTLIKQATINILEEGLPALPVVSHDKSLIGILTRTDILSLIVSSPHLEMII